GAPAMLLTLAAPVVALRRKKQPALAVGTLALAGVGVVIWSGGDCYSGGRFLALPTTLGVVGAAVQAAKTRGLRIALSVTVLVQGALIPITVASLLSADRAALKRHLRTGIPVREGSFVCDRDASTKLREAFAPTGVVAQTDYQRLKY